MSLFSSLSIAQSGLSAVSTQLQVVSNNVSNAGTEGYTKKTAVVSSANLGTIGGGIQVVGFTRSTDTALFTTLSKATSNAGLRTTQDEYLQQVQDILGTSSSDDPPLSEAVTEFVNSWTAFASEPESSVAEQTLIQSAVTLVDEIHRISEEVEALDRQCHEDIDSTLTDLGSYLEQIQDLNEKISMATTGGESAGDLEDERDQLILKVSEITSIKVLERDNGQVALYTSTGYQLVDGSTVRSFAYDGINVYDENNPALSLNTALTGGKLEALVRFRDTSATATSSTDTSVGVIQKMRDQLDAIAQAFLTPTSTATSGEVTFAAAYDAATAGTGELAADFFDGYDPMTSEDARFNIEVNAALLDGTSRVKADAASPVVDALIDSTRTFSASGLTTSGSSYSSLVTASTTVFQQAANSAATLSESATEQQDYLSEKLTNATNVNTDEEMIALVTLQNIYAANARVLSAIQEMFSVLQSTVA